MTPVVIPDQPPPVDGVEGEHLLRLVASAIIRLSRQSGPGETAVYDATVQSAYNHVVLSCLRTRQAPPASVPDMVAWAARRPIGDWPWALPEDFESSSAYLVDAETRTPTQECWEWQVSARDVLAEQVENQLMLDAIAQCQVARAPESYTAFRQLLIRRPVLTDVELATATDALDLELLHELIRRSYEPAPSSYVRGGVFSVCGRCGCLLVPITQGRYVCELQRCRRDQHPQVGRTITARPGSTVYQLTRPLRMFITGPGLAETDLEAQLLDRGLRPEMWPNFDAYDLRITLPNGRVWAVDVKDRSNPALLGRTAQPLRRDPAYDEGFLVAPAYRFVEREDYGRVYDRRRRTDVAGTPDLISDRELLARVDRELARTHRAATSGKGAVDA